MREAHIICPTGQTSLKKARFCVRFSGGGEESRTPVRKPVYLNFYERSRRIKSFVAARPPTGLRFRQPQDPAAGEAGLRLVPHIDDARIHSRGQLWADGRAVRPLRAYSCCCQLYLKNFPFFTKHGASARLSGTHDPRRNHLRPRVMGSAVRSNDYYTPIQNKINLFQKKFLTLTQR